MKESILDDIKIKGVKERSLERRLECFFKIMELPDRQIPDINRLYESLDLTEADLQKYQIQKELEVSMKPTQKRDLVVETVMKPLMKSAGFKWVKGTWWRELNDGILFIYLRSSRYNGMGTGATFSFEIDAFGDEEMCGKTARQWILEKGRVYDKVLRVSDFLPQWGFLSPYHGGWEYKIDGYRNFLPLDQPISDILSAFKYEFENDIIPRIEEIETMVDWYKLYEEKMNRRKEKEFGLLSYYNEACMCAPYECNFPSVAAQQKRFNLTDEDIRRHYNWLDIIVAKTPSPQRDVKYYIEKALQLRQEP